MGRRDLSNRVNDRSPASNSDRDAMPLRNGSGLTWSNASASEALIVQSGPSMCTGVVVKRKLNFQVVRISGKAGNRVRGRSASRGKAMNGIYGISNAPGDT